MGGKRKSPTNEDVIKKKSKRPPNAFSLFVKSMWEKEEKRENFPSFTKGCSAKWAKMTGEDKQTYVDEAATLKDKWSGDNTETKKVDSKKKRTPSPYIMFCSDMREQVKKEHPNFTMPQITKELGRLWKSLSDNDKAKYHQKASEEKDKNNLETEKPVPEEKEETEVIDEKATEKPKKKKGKAAKTANTAAVSA